MLSVKVTSVGATTIYVSQTLFWISSAAYEVPYKIAYFEGDRCTGWDYLRE